MEFFAYEEKTGLFSYPSQLFPESRPISERKQVLPSDKRAVICQDYQDHLAALFRQEREIYPSSPVQRKAVQVSVFLNREEWKFSPNLAYLDPLTFFTFSPVLDSGEIRYGSQTGIDYLKFESGLRRMPFDQVASAQPARVRLWKSEDFILILKR